MISVAATGFFTGFSLILAIGAQNTFVLRQGLLRQHVFALCLLCAFSDAILISLGVAGFGWLVSLSPNLPILMSLAGAVFLLSYGGLRFRAAIKGDYTPETATSETGLWRVLATGAALTWLNPHVYLDTLGLIGAISTQYTVLADKFVFASAAMLASFVFFFGLGYGARLLSPIMQTARAWRIFDTLVGLVMWALAVNLVLNALRHVAA